MMNQIFYQWTLDLKKINKFVYPHGYFKCLSKEVDNSSIGLKLITR